MSAEKNEGIIINIINHSEFEFIFDQIVLIFKKFINEELTGFERIKNRILDNIKDDKTYENNFSFFYENGNENDLTTKIITEIGKANIANIRNKIISYFKNIKRILNNQELKDIIFYSHFLCTDNILDETEENNFKSNSGAFFEEEKIIQNQFSNIHKFSTIFFNKMYLNFDLKLIKQRIKKNIEKIRSKLFESLKKILYRKIEILQMKKSILIKYLLILKETDKIIKIIDAKNSNKAIVFPSIQNV